VSTPLPEGQQGAKAEALTDKIQAAINLGILPPPFLLALEKSPLSLGQKNNLVQVEVGQESTLYTQTVEGIAYENDKKLTDSEKTDAIKKRNDYFNNDSFWLIAPFKLRDAGTRSIVMQDNQEAL
jgi:hypothetical protein